MMKSTAHIYGFMLAIQMVSCGGGHSDRKDMPTETPDPSDMADNGTDAVIPISDCHVRLRVTYTHTDAIIHIQIPAMGFLVVLGTALVG